MTQKELNEKLKELEGKFDDLQKSINDVYPTAKPICEKSEYFDKHKYVDFFPGHMMKNRVRKVWEGTTTWIYPDHFEDNPEIEKKIEDNKIYKVWYNYTCDTYPGSSREQYVVYYIEEVSPDTPKIKEFVKTLVNKLKY